MRQTRTYIHQLSGWPGKLAWDSEEVGDFLGAVRHSQGVLRGRMESLGFPEQQRANLDVLAQDVSKSSEIEGEKLDVEQVRSSLAGRLGIDVGGLRQVDRSVDGIVEMILDATQRYDQPLTELRLYRWHRSLFPIGYNKTHKVQVGVWRDDESGPMRVVSGQQRQETIHFEAPAASRIQEEMEEFLRWFNETHRLDPVLKAALAHLWFVTIHPFEDGNGRIARAIADMALARAENSSLRFYSMSAVIQSQRKTYYDILEQTQTGDLNITSWMLWFLECLGTAIQEAEATLKLVLEKARFWRVHEHLLLNARQKKMLNKLLDGFDAKVITSRWASINHCSQDTAGRDINDLIEKGLLTTDSQGGRNASYLLVEAR